jgi:hypothetical protein
MKAMNRRWILQSLAAGVSGGALAEGQTAPAVAPDAAPGIEALRNVAAAHGLELDEQRLQVMQKVLPHRQANLKAVREFEVGDEVGL